MSFKEIETKSKSAYAAEQLINAIKNGVYKVGDRLPPERELAERMGISRPLIREALSALQIAEVIESRAGDGTYIRKSIGNMDIETHILATLEGEEDPIVVIEARMLLEGGTARLAATHISTEELKRVERILEQEQVAGEKAEYASYVKADRKFHLVIVAASRNQYLEAAARPLIDTMGKQLWRGIDQLYLFNPQGIAQTLKEHEHILEAIKRRNPREAEKAMRRHLARARDRFLGDDQQEVSSGQEDG